MTALDQGPSRKVPFTPKVYCFIQSQDDPKFAIPILILQENILLSIVSCDQKLKSTN